MTETQSEELSVKQVLNIAVKNHKEGKLRAAGFLYKKILEKYPENANALHLLGLVLHQEGRNEEAIKYVGRAIELSSKNALFYFNLGMIYDELGMEEKSAENFKKALEIDENFAKAGIAHYNLGVFYVDRGMSKEALMHYNRAIELDKNFYEARWNRSLALLHLGRFEEGWKEYEYRFKKEKPSDSRIFGRQKWDGCSLEGKRILIASEQGFGDNIHFIRYIPFVKNKGGHVILECKKELRKLFEGFNGVDEIIDKKINIVPDVRFDFYIHLMSLPAVFNTNVDNIPNKIPYLKAKQQLAEKFKRQFSKNKFNIGIVWAGNPEQENDKNRSTRFENFKIFKEIPGIKLYSLQKGEAALQLNDKEIINLESQINDFADTSAFIENLDLIISVDTSVAHLAGAMGKMVWVLLSTASDWRWLRERKDSPWYPSMKLFRQKELGDWEHVFEEARRELVNLLAVR